MNRNQEYWDLIRDLNDTPAALEGTVDRARAKARRTKAGRWLGIPVASLGGVAAAFVLLVNCSTPFAMACGRVPVLRELAAAVSLSPSLKAAVEHDFVQRLDLEQTVNGVTLRLDYMIVDQTQMNVFFTVSGTAQRYEVRPSVTDSSGRLEGSASLTSGFAQAGELGSFLIDLSRTGTLPPVVQLTCTVIPHNAPLSAEAPVPLAETERGDLGRYEEPDPVTTFTFELTLDPRFTAPGETVEMDQWVTVEGQRLHFQSLTIYPTHARLSVAADPENTAKLVGLDFYLEDDKGTRYESGSRRDGSATISSGDAEEGGSTYYLESPYFDRAEHLTLTLTGARWLDLDRQRVTVDIGRDRALDPMPEGTRFGTARRRGADVVVVLFGQESRNISNWSYWDPEGGEHHIDSMSSTQSDRVWLGGEDYFPVPEGYQSEEFTLSDYPWDTVELGMSYSRTTAFSSPITLAIK